MLKIKIIAKEVTLERGRKFYSFWTPMKLIVKGEESKGKQIKGVTVKFNKELNITSLYKGGFIEVDEKELYAPYIYEIKTQGNGDKVYPFVYIKNINKITPFKSNKEHFNLQDSFETDELEEVKDKDLKEIK